MRRQLSTQWVNKKLTEADQRAVDDVAEAFHDGVALATLIQVKPGIMDLSDTIQPMQYEFLQCPFMDSHLQVLSGDKVRINRHARMAALKLDNLVQCFHVLEKSNVDTRNIKPKGVYSSFTCS